MVTTRHGWAGSERASDPSHDDNPAVVYRDSLSRGSYWAVHHALVTVAELLDGKGTDPWTFPWWELEYRHTARVRRDLVDRYAPATVNKMFTVLRGVLKTCWRLGLMDAETYRRAADIANVRAKTLPAGRGVERDEVAALLEVCAADASPAGRRDGALVAILYGAGLRRAEVCGLDLADFDAAGCALAVRAGKGRRDRQVFLTSDACRLVRAWVTARGEEDGPLFCPVDAGGRVRVSRLGGESVHYVLKKRQQQAGLSGITPHDFRRGMVSRLLDAGVDVFTVQQLAGHADAVTTARYDRRGEEARRAAAQLLTIPATI
jgi:integrase